MTSTPSPIQGVADTARWVALYRALESERPDAHFHDPYARRLAGARGEAISRAMPRSARKANWAFVARTWLFDQFIQSQVAAGVSHVLNLAAGLDSRPYRLALPRSLKWIEVDQPALLEEKSAVLADVEPTCSLERVPLDLAAEGPRRDLFRRIGAESRSVLVVTEGLLVYLTQQQVAQLAGDLAAQPTFQSWVTDLTSPALLRIIDRDWGRALRDGGAPLHFAPEAGPAFFADHGWDPTDIRPTFTTGAKLRRMPLFLRLLASLPNAGRFHPRRPWSATCLLTRRGAR